MNPLQVIMKSLGLMKKKVIEAKLDFFWTALCLGAAACAETDNEKEIIIWIINEKENTKSWKTFFLKEMDAKMIKNIFFHIVEKIQESESSMPDTKQEICLQYFLKIGFNFNVCDNKGNTVFHKVVDCQTFEWLEDLTKNIKNLDVAVNRPNSASQTPIHLAAANGNMNFMEYLINKKADVNVQDSSLRTPLHYAVLHKQQDCVEKLLGRNACRNILDCKMKSPFDPEDEDVEKEVEEEEKEKKSEILKKKQEVSSEC